MADVFGKRHDHVLREVEKSIEGLDEKGNAFKFTNKGTYVFPHRAILRVRMLLRDSEIECKAPFTKRDTHTVIEYRRKGYCINYRTLLFS